MLKEKRSAILKNDLGNIGECFILKNTNCSHEYYFFWFYCDFSAVGIVSGDYYKRK